LYLPREDKTLTIAECLPIKRLRFEGWCKYCHTTHRDWWQMKEADYGRADIVLCGKCEHTSIRDDAEHTRPG
jgi:hypothetical protein